MQIGLLIHYRHDFNECYNHLLYLSRKYVRLMCDTMGLNEKYDVWAWLEYAVAHAQS